MPSKKHIRLKNDPTKYCGDIMSKPFFQQNVLALADVSLSPFGYISWLSRGRSAVRVIERRQTPSSWLTMFFVLLGESQ